LEIADMATIQDQIAVLLKVNTKGELGLVQLKPGEVSPKAVKVSLFTVGDKGARELYKRAAAEIKANPEEVKWPEVALTRNGDERGGDPARHQGEAKLWIGKGRANGGFLFWTSAEKVDLRPNSGRRVRYL
jgi:hypothetical protein